MHLCNCIKASCNRPKLTRLERLPLLQPVMLQGLPARTNRYLRSMLPVGFVSATKTAMVRSPVPPLGAGEAATAMSCGDATPSSRQLCSAPPGRRKQQSRSLQARLTQGCQPHTKQHPTGICQLQAGNATGNANNSTSQCSSELSKQVYNAWA